MGLASTKNISIHHVHIPRTGGTYINELFKMNDLILDYFWGTEWPNTDEMILSEKVDETTNFLRSDTFMGIDVRFLHNPMYFELSDDFKNVDHRFAVVRDPYDRFISALACSCLSSEQNYNLPRVLKDLEDRDYFFKFMKIMREKIIYRTNFFRPMVEFITEDTKIYKFENGLYENFLNWFEENFNIKLLDGNADGKWIDYNLFREYGDSIKGEILEGIEINPVIKEYVKEYYAADYERFGY